MKKALIIAAIALVITAGITSFVSAQGQNKMNKPELTTEMKAEWETRKIEMEAQQGEMQNIMENGTYEEWKALVESRPRMTDYITEENFEKFREVHKLKQAGDYEGAKELWEELGIDKEFGMRKGGSNKGMNKEGKGDCGCQK